MLSLYDELKNLTRALHTHGIPYALCGGLAVAIHDRPRATVDMDLLILAESLPQVIDLARLQGYVLSAKPMTFAQGAVEIRRVSKLDSETGDLVSLDLLLVTPQLQAVWASRQQVSWEGEALSVVSRDGLIELKLLRSSGQDLDDIKRLRGETTDES
jgi:hypothetical protein